MSIKSGLSRIFNAAQSAYITMTAGVNSPHTSEATKDMTAIFAAAAVFGAATGNVPLAIGGAIGAALGVESIRLNGRSFLNPAPGNRQPEPPAP